MEGTWASGEAGAFLSLASEGISGPKPPTKYGVTTEVSGVTGWNLRELLTEFQVCLSTGPHLEKEVIPTIGPLQAQKLEP